MLLPPKTEFGFSETVPELAGLTVTVEFADPPLADAVMTEVA